MKRNVFRNTGSIIGLNMSLKNKVVIQFYESSWLFSFIENSGWVDGEMLIIHLFNLTVSPYSPGSKNIFPNVELNPIKAIKSPILLG